jgi:sialate O-acetylesterase
LRLTYAATGLNLVLQEIDIIGDAVIVPIQLQPASMFSDDMILQRDNAVPVWGTSDPGAAITVEFAGQTKVTTAASNGTWRVDLDPMAASTNARTLTVTAELDSKTTQVSFSNVLVGEVWLCSGQSNMAWTLDKTDNGPAVVAAANHPTLRLFKVPQVSTTTPLERIDAVWTECTPETAGGSFGVAYYFARTLQTELDVPVGLMMSARGGTAIELWYPGSGGYYNGMIDALIPFAMRGVIWYQGENNVTDGMLYVDKKKHLVNSWRDLWGYEFPFYYVQLAPFNYGGGRDGTLPYFWEAQSAILGVITNTGMAVITDTVTNLNGIHPTNKEGPGIRLALLALDNTYGLDIVSTGPVFQSLETVSNTLQVTFDSSDGLTTSDSLAPDWFELEVSDGVYTAAAAVVSNNLVILSATGVDVPTAMRFAWSEIAQPNLRNSAGLVASAFRAELGPFGLWTVEFGLSGSNALYTADPDGDVLDNLGEYALGGNPTNGSDRGYVPIFGPLEENGTNWFEYVYARRRDAAARCLDYTVEATSNMVSAAWSTNNITETGAVAIDGDFEWVTNRIPLYVQGFLHLMIELVE